MTEQMQETDVLLDALEAFERLQDWLGALRGDALVPDRVEDRTHGLGALAAWVVETDPEPVAEDAPAPFRRVLAVLHQEWGEAAAQRDNLPQAEAWLRTAVELRSSLPLPSAAAELIFDRQVEAATHALHRGAADSAALHWRLLIASGAPPSRRQLLVRRAVAREEGIALAGMERGVVGGELAAIERLARYAEVELQSEPLHRAILRLSSHAALRYHGHGDGDAFERTVRGASGSLKWAAGRSEAGQDLASREQIAEAAVCAAAVCAAPWEAVAHLRCALRYRPAHPTARRLLGLSLAALAARRLGHGRQDEALAAAREARALFADLEFHHPDRDGWGRLLRELEIGDEPV